MTHVCETIFGRILRGKVLSERKTDHVRLCEPDEESTDDLLRAFFGVEESPGKSSVLVGEHQQAVDYFQKNSISKY